jgi:hypothetical protein
MVLTVVNGDQTVVADTVVGGSKAPQRYRIKAGTASRCTGAFEKNRKAVPVTRRRAKEAEEVV